MQRWMKARNCWTLLKREVLHFLFGIQPDAEAIAAKLAFKKRNSRPKEARCSFCQIDVSGSKDSRKGNFKFNNS